LGKGDRFAVDEVIVNLTYTFPLQTQKDATRQKLKIKFTAIAKNLAIAVFLSIICRAEMLCVFILKWCHTCCLFEITKEGSDSSEAAFKGDFKHTEIALGYKQFCVAYT
jgi:hypothetical protein